MSMPSAFSNKAFAALASSLLTAKMSPMGFSTFSAVAFMEANAGTAYTASELIREIPELDAISTQKLSPILKKAALEGRIVKVKTSKATKWGVGIEVEETE